MSSGSVYRRSKSDSNGVNDEENPEISATGTDKEPKRKKGLHFQFSKLRNSLKSSFSCSSASSPDSSRGYGGRLLCCCACLKEPEVVEIPEGDLDDPEGFSYECLKSMIERNDFYSKECDTHID